MSHQYPGHFAVVDWLRRNGPATTREVAQALGMPQAVARNRLQSLLAADEVTVTAQRWETR